MSSKDSKEFEVEILPYRRCGNTTRQIDAEIQELFKTGKTIVRDHARINKFGEIKEGGQRLHVNMLFSRLSREHHLILKEDFTYDVISGEIKLIPDGQQ